MDLFNNDSAFNLVPRDGMVNYYGKIFDAVEATDLFASLYNGIEWEHDRLIMFGKEIITARRVAWYGDEELPYSYSGTKKKARIWTSELSRIRSKIQTVTGETFNTCLLNLYDDGSQGMGWHSDDEKELRKDSSIASLSLGAERKFSFRHKITKEVISLVLDNGSLLAMRGETQRHWQHSIPKSKRVATPRINLTFRTIG